MEIDALVPGKCHFTIDLDVELNKKLKTNIYYKPKADFSKTLPEHIIAKDYSNALKDCMEEAMKETFDLLGSEIPAASSVASSLYWIH
jgi:hypothetical protein